MNIWLRLESGCQQMVVMCCQMILKAFDSNANFVLVAFERDATEVFEALKTRGILVKNMTKAHELLHNCLRLTVGTDAENRSLLVALQDILK